MRCALHPPIDPERGEGVSCPLQAPPAELAEGRRGPRVPWGHARAVRDSRRETQGVRLRYRSRRHSRHPPSPVLSWLLTSDRPLTVGAAAYHMHLVRVRCAWAHARAHSTQASAHATAHARARARTHTHTHTHRSSRRPSPWSTSSTSSPPAPTRRGLLLVVLKLLY